MFAIDESNDNSLEGCNGSDAHARMLINKSIALEPKTSLVAATAHNNSINTSPHSTDPPVLPSVRETIH